MDRKLLHTSDSGLSITLLSNATELPGSSRHPRSTLDKGPFNKPEKKALSQTSGSALDQSELWKPLFTPATRKGSTPGPTTSLPATRMSPPKTGIVKQDLNSMVKILQNEGLGEDDMVIFHGLTDQAWVIFDCKNGRKFTGPDVRTSSDSSTGETSEVNTPKGNLSRQPAHRKKMPSSVANIPAEERLRFQKALEEYMNEVFTMEDSQVIFLLESPQLNIIDPFRSNIPPNVCQALWARAMVQIKSGFLSKEDAETFFEKVGRDSKLALLLLQKME